MNMMIRPAPLGGTVAAISSKSDAHRALICASLVPDGQPTELLLADSSRDTDATIGCLRALGAVLEPIDGGVRVTSIAHPRENARLDCGESGSTLRFLLPVVAALGCGATLIGSERLFLRPMAPLLRVLTERGCTLLVEGTPSIVVRGRLTPGHALLPGNISSQFATGLLLAAPAVGGTLTLELLPPVESAGYLAMTVRTLARFGVSIAQEGACFTLRDPTLCSPARYPVEGDWSNAAFWLAAGMLGCGVTVTGLDPASPQGDRAILTLLRAAGGKLSQCGHTVAARPGQRTAQRIDAAQIPDLIPILAVVAALSDGVTEI
ncbi:MAG: 3-phosphoshikimate 1-carboxyvinyltransferase, partial [Oscillospiraceae bacterium]